MTPAETVSRWAMFLDKPIEVEDAIAALVKAERERATPAPVRAEGEAITEEMLRRAYSVPLIEGRGPDVFDRERLRFALAAALKAEDSLHG